MLNHPTGARRAGSALIAALALAAAPGAHAEAAYPNRPIRMVLPSGAGTVTDQTARLVAEWQGQTVTNFLTLLVSDCAHFFSRKSNADKAYP